MLWRRPQLSETQTRAEDAITSTLRGGDSLPAWNAVWDLVQDGDASEKAEMLAALRGYVDSAVAGEPVEQAQEFEAALEASLKPPRQRAQVLPSAEVRQQHKREQIKAHRKAMNDIGVREGEGLPMWVMYMTRRNKRSWK